MKKRILVVFFCSLACIILIFASVLWMILSLFGVFNKTNDETEDFLNKEIKLDEDVLTNNANEFFYNCYYGEHATLEYKHVKPSCMYELASKFKNIYVLHIYYNDNNEYELVNSKINEKYKNDIYFDGSYTGYLIKEHTKLKEYASLIVSSSKEMRISYVFIDCPKIDTFSEKHFVFYTQAWNVSPIMLIFGEGYKWRQQGG